MLKLTTAVTADESVIPRYNVIGVTIRAMNFHMSRPPGVPAGFTAIHADDILVE